MHVQVTPRELLYHIRWKIRLRKFYEGSERISGEEIEAADRSSFDKWLYSTKTIKHVSGDTLGQLARLHVEFHTAVERMYNCMTSGDRKAAQKQLIHIDAIHAKIFAVLVAMRVASLN